jgi:dipeptidyl aminopeptidase/acylaminoacyl peptidase
MRMISTLLLLIAVVGGAGAAAETPALELIMSDPDWIGNAPEQPWWSDDASQVYFRQKQIGEDYRDVFRVPRAGGAPVRLTPAQRNKDSGPEAVYNLARDRSAWVAAGDVYLKHLQTGEVVQVTNTLASESSPIFLVDGQTLGFKRDGAYFLYSIRTGGTRQLSDIRFEEDPFLPKDFDPLRDQQRRSYEAVVENLRRKQTAEAAQREQRDGGRAYTMHPVYLGKKWLQQSRWLSPDGQHLLLLLKSAEHKDKHDQMPQYVNEAGTVATREVRERVGRATQAAPVYVMVDLASGEFDEIDTSDLPGRKRDPLKKLRQKAIAWHIEQGAQREAVEKQLEAPSLRDLAHLSLAWSPRGKRVAVMASSLDHKDRWLFTIASADNKVATQDHLQDEAWVNWAYNQFGWLADGERLWFQSERSGYNHLYLKALVRKKALALTAGEFVVREPRFNPAGDRAWLVANRSHPGEWEVYSVAAAGGELQQITELAGVSSFTLAADASALLVSRSAMDAHADLYVTPADGNGAAQRITDTVSEQFKAIDWIIPQIVKVPSSHTRRPIYSKLYLPPGHDPDQTYPSVMFVHGAGYTQNAHMGWPYYFREFMFHTILANAGYVVLDMDYRASQGYGRDWRTTIYRNMGHPELEDYLDGIEWLVKTQGVDRKRVGIYGGSYGGFMTFMALFRAPDAFAAGAALRPVVDWMHYNHGYTSSILNTPDIDPWAYQKSSPINFASGLNSPLLIATGMQDDNVFFQDSVLLVQRLLELKKEDFEIAIYPLDGHGFTEPTSWLDEYRRIYKLMNRNLRSGAK